MNTIEQEIDECFNQYYFDENTYEIKLDILKLKELLKKHLTPNQ